MTTKTKSNRRRKFATIDCETDPFKYNRVPKPFVWGYYDENGFQYFFDTEEFKEFIKKQDRIIYAHNGGKFDFHFLLDGLEPQEKIMIINGRLAKLKYGEAELRDSFLLLPVPLSAYKKDEISYDIFEADERRKPENIKSIVEYLKGDCKYLYDILEVNFELYGQKLTLASSAFSFWHSKFNPYQDKPKSTYPFFRQFKKYYYGGRVECFKKGIIEKPFSVVDIRSAYPNAMQFEHPYGTEYDCSGKLHEANIEKSFYDIDAISNGAFPFRNKEKKRLEFPNDGEIRNYKISGWELKKALETNSAKIIRVNEETTFCNTINFKDYVQHFFKEKEAHREGSKAHYLLAKVYMNSLYGKFGQSSEDHRDYELCELEHIEGYINEGFAFEGILGKFALMSEPIPDFRMNFYNVATAASITGFVRAYLLEHIIKSEGVLYCDTDSLACEKFNGVIGEELGQWENEGKFKRGAIGGKKLYAFERENPKKDERFKISSKGAKLTAEEIFEIASGKSIEYFNQAPTFSIKKSPEFIKRTIKMT